jgi:hypothetical protein
MRTQNDAQSFAGMSAHDGPPLFSNLPFQRVLAPHPCPTGTLAVLATGSCMCGFKIYFIAVSHTRLSSERYVAMVHLRSWSLVCRLHPLYNPHANMIM